MVKSWAAAILLASLVLTAGCRPSAPSESGWRDSADQAVSDMVSEVATSRLTVQQALRDRLPGRYPVVVLTYTEEAAGKAAQSVSTLQPPPSAKPAYGELTGLLSDATDVIAQARIAQSGGDERQRHEAVAQLDKVLARLHRLQSQIGAGP